MIVKTGRNRIHAEGFKSTVPAKKPELTQCHKDARLAFSRTHARWNNPQCFPTSPGFIYGEWTAENESGGGDKNGMVWAGISATAKTDLVIIDGNLNGQ